jgi:hypothetical protein
MSIMPEAKSEKNDAISSAAIAAVAGALAYGLKKALADRDGSTRDPAEIGELRSRSILPVIESAPDMLLPLVENAAGAAGKWVAENAPEVIRDRLLPRFIGAFTDAAKGRR